MSDTRTALVIGAGIGGLAAGLVLGRAGWTVRIHEQANSPRELGFGLALAPNALRALQELGIAEPVVRSGSGLAGFELRHTSGRVLRRLDAQRLGVPAVVALRSQLHGALLGAIDREALRLGSEAVSFTDNAGGVTLHLKDGGTDTGTLLVGADGVHSVIRRSLHPTESPPRLSGFCAVRGVAYGAGHHLGDLSGVGYLGNAIEAATVRASSDDAVYWYMSLRSRDVVDPLPEAILSTRCPGFDPALRAILSATRPDDMRFDRLYLRAPLHTWGAGHVTLLGDAAHLLLPHTGQGAAQALEDGVALGLAVRGPGSVEQALRRYEAVRSRRTRAFIKMGPRIARTTTTSNVAIRIARWLAIRMTPERLLALSARGLHGDPHRELRPRPAA